MYGITAISYHNGWQIAMLGILIVFCGLSLLSLIISQIPKILKIWEERDVYYRHAKAQLNKENGKQAGKESAMPEHPHRRKDDSPLKDTDLPPYMRDFADQIELLVDYLGQPFALPKMLDLAINRGLVRPHSNINYLILVKLIVPDEYGYYSWDKRRYRNFIEKKQS